MAYLEAHAARIYDSIIRRDVIAGQAVASRILTGDLHDGFSVRDIYRNGWVDLTSKDDAKAAVELLLDLDWIQEREMPTRGRRKVEYDINPRLKGAAT